MKMQILITKYTMLVCMLMLLASAGAQQPVTKVTLGIKPDYWHSISGGVTIAEVIEGKTAQKAGMKAKDVIIAFDGKVVKDIFDYKNRLDQYAPGSKARITILRDKKALYFDVTF